MLGKQDGGRQRRTEGQDLRTDTRIAARYTILALFCTSMVDSFVGVLVTSCVHGYIDYRGDLQRGQHVHEADAEEAAAAGDVAARPRRHPHAPRPRHQTHLTLPPQSVYHRNSMCMSQTIKYIQSRYVLLGQMRVTKHFDTIDTHITQRNVVVVPWSTLWWY